VPSLSRRGPPEDPNKLFDFDLGLYF
jgi:hypothetical protein